MGTTPQQGKGKDQLAIHHRQSTRQASKALPSYLELDGPGTSPAKVDEAITRAGLLREVRAVGATAACAFDYLDFGRVGRDRDAHGLWNLSGRCRLAGTKTESLQKRIYCFHLDFLHKTRVIVHLTTTRRGVKDHSPGAGGPPDCRFLDKSLQLLIHCITMTEIRVLKVPDNLKRSLKVRAASEGKGLNDLMLEIIAAAVEKTKAKGRGAA